MNLRESGRLGWRSIRDHKLRSVLTTLGVVIGVGAVITFVTLGSSLQVAVVGDVSDQSSPEMTASVALPGQTGPGNGPGEGAGDSGGSLPIITERDVDQLRQLSRVTEVTPQGTVQVTSLRAGTQTYAWESVTATTPNAFDTQEFEEGEPFTAGRSEAVLTRSGTALFDPNVAVGDELTIQFDGNRSRTLTVVGILNASAQQGAVSGGQPQIYVPTDPFYDSTVRDPKTDAAQLVYPQVTIRAASYEDVPEVESAVEDYLAERSDARALIPGSYEFSVQTNEQLVEQIRSMLRTFTGFTTGIAVISLLVGSIGIANIMLVSVTERTREIGIMKAVGAQRRDILQLFVVESIILGVIGAIAGVGLGIIGAYVATKMMGFPVVFAPRWFAIAVLVGIGVGTAAGLYPAWNASRVDPITALRHE